MVAEIIVLRAILEHMTPKAKQILITSESREVIVISHSDRYTTIEGFCPVCGITADMMTFDGAVTQSGINGRELLRLASTGEVHSVEDPDGHLHFCGISLSRWKS